MPLQTFVNLTSMLIENHLYDQSMNPRELIESVVIEFIIHSTPALNFTVQFSSELTFHRLSGRED